MLRRIAGPPGHAEYFDQVTRERGVDAEVGAERILDGAAIGEHHAGQCHQQLLALLQRGERIAQERGTLALDDLPELGDRLRVPVCGVRLLPRNCRHHSPLLVEPCG